MFISFVESLIVNGSSAPLHKMVLAATQFSKCYGPPNVELIGSGSLAVSFEPWFICLK